MQSTAQKMERTEKNYLFQCSQTIGRRLAPSVASYGLWRLALFEERQLSSTSIVAVTTTWGGSGATFVGDL